MERGGLIRISGKAMINHRPRPLYSLTERGFAEYSQSKTAVIALYKRDKEPPYECCRFSPEQ